MKVTGSGFSLIELMIVIAIISILATVAVPLYGDYQKKARSSEVPENLKVIVREQLSTMFNPSVGRFVTDLATIGWHTSNGTSTGRYYHFSTSGVSGCEPGTYDNPAPEGLSEAVALNFDDVPSNYFSACMDSKSRLLTNSR